MADKGYVFTIVGATGAVGKEMLHLLEERAFPVRELRAVASARSVGKSVDFAGQSIIIRELAPKTFEGSEIVFISAGTPISKEFAPIAARAGAVVLDDSGAFRMDPELPLVVPEINGDQLSSIPEKRIFPVANCSVIQLVLALAPIHKKAGIKRVVVSTYQSTSGAGKRAMEELSKQVLDLFNYREPKVEVLPKRIAFDLIPQIDSFREDGSTGEEEKICAETKKILRDPKMGVSVTAVRVPTFHGHAESVNIETERPLSEIEARELLEKAEGIQLMDDEETRYPMLTDAVGQDDVYVGRVRKDPSRENCLNLWVVGDNLRKGAALNAIQILEKLREKSLI